MSDRSAVAEFLMYGPTSYLVRNTAPRGQGAAVPDHALSSSAHAMMNPVFMVDVDIVPRVCGCCGHFPRLCGIAVDTVLSVNTMKSSYSGSPLGLFLALRGMDPSKGRALGSAPATQASASRSTTPDGLPAARRMYNLYQPYDPVAYRQVACTSPCINSTTLLPTGRLPLQ